jgi:ABC-type glycerol-3-phosphate transport system substrate-binding protein
MSWKRTGFALLGIAYVLALSAVGWRAWRERESGRVTIRLSHWQLEGTVREGISAVIRRYEQVNPRVHVVPVVVPDGSYIEWMQAQLAGGTGPDIVEYTMFWGRIQELAPRYFQPITAEVAKPNPYDRGTPMEGLPWRETFLDGMSNPDGHVRLLHEYYAPTIAAFTMRIFYNRPLLREITGSDRPPATWRELLALCGRVRAASAGRPRPLFPFSGSQQNTRWIAEPVMQGVCAGASARLDHNHTLDTSMEEGAIGFLRGEWDYHTPEVACGLAVLRDLGRASQPGFIQVGRDVAMLDFLRGEALMICAGSWDASSLAKEASFEVGAFRLPLPSRDDPGYGPLMLGPLGEGAVSTATSFYLNRDSAHKAEALDFLRFLTSVEGDQIFADTSNWLPSIRGVRTNAFSSQFRQANVDGYVWKPDGAVFFSGIGENLNQIFLREMNQLFAPNGGVGAMQAALDRVAPEAIGRDVRAYLRDARSAFNGSDARLAAQRYLGMRASRPPAPAALLEARYYQMADALAHSPLASAP